MFRHEFREDNGRADELTHLARNGQTFYKTQRYLWPFESHLEPFAMRGAFDGGVCALGSGCGFWLQVGLINKGYVSESWDNPRPVGPFPPGLVFSCSSAVPLVWRDAAEAAWLLEGATITECELSAAEALLCAVRSLLRDLDSSSCLSAGL